MYLQQLTAYTGPSGLRYGQSEEPAADGRVLIDLAAAGVSYPDLLQSTGGYQMVRELPCILGVEGAGVVRQAPAGSGLRPGARVACLVPEGTWRQVVAVDPAFVFELPENVSMAAGSGFLMNYFTAWFALVERARAGAGETVLVHGAAGGLGIAALQIAAALGLESLAVVSSSAKADTALANRATHVIHLEGWREEVRRITGGRGVDVVLDPVGGDRFTDSLRSLAPCGRLVVLGFVGGDIPTVKVNRLLLNNISVLGAGWGEFVRAQPGYLARQWAAMEPLLASGALRVAEPRMYQFADAAAALTALQQRTAAGKLALDFSALPPAPGA